MPLSSTYRGRRGAPLCKARSTRSRIGPDLKRWSTNCTNRRWACKLLCIEPRKLISDRMDWALNTVRIYEVRRPSGCEIHTRPLRSGKIDRARLICFRKSSAQKPMREKHENRGHSRKGCPGSGAVWGSRSFFSHSCPGPKARQAWLVFGDRTRYLLPSAFPRQRKPANFRIRG